MPHEVVVIGSYVQDHVWLGDRFLTPGETRRARAFHTGPGGKGFNQAVAAHRMGADVLFVGAIGDDALGRTARRTADQEGLVCAWQVVDDRPTAACGIVVDADGRNQISVYLGANEALDGGFLASQRERIAGARVVLLQLEIPLDTVVAALALAGDIGALRVLNPAPMHDDLPRAALDACDVLTPNETEFAALLARHADVRLDAARVAQLSDDAIDAYCRKLGVATVVVTLGEAGCFVSHRDGAPLSRGEPRRYRLPAEAVRAVDTTGAGDAFSGALAAALAARDAGFRDAAIRAARAAALSTERVGAAGAMPRADEVAARFG